MLDLLFRKRKLKRDLDALRREIEAKRAGVAEAEKECRKAWGKKWSYIQMQRRKKGANGSTTSRAEEIDGQAEVFEMRRQQHLAVLKAREQELDELLSKERKVATELGVEPIASPEVHDEER